MGCAVVTMVCAANFARNVAAQTMITAAASGRDGERVAGSGDGAAGGGVGPFEEEQGGVVGRWAALVAADGVRDAA